MDLHGTDVGGTSYADNYLEMIKALPGYKFYPAKYDGKTPTLFTFDGGEGLLMPLRVPVE